MNRAMSPTTLLVGVTFTMSPKAPAGRRLYRVTLIYAAVFLAVGAYLFRKRDA